MRYLFLSVLVVCVIGIMIPSAFAETYNVSNAPGSSTPGCENTNSCFIPNVLNIQVGDSVIWTNDDTTVHTITSGTSSGGTDGAFDSSLIQPGSSYSLTFPNAYSYNYFCIVHPWMEGIVTVTSSTPTPTPTPTTINVSTDKTSYQSGDTIYVSGKITNPIEGKDVTITVVAPSGEIIVADQITVPSGGTFQTKFVFDRQDTGTYTVTANYGSASDTLTFQFTKPTPTGPTPLTLILNQVPSTAQEGDTITFSGQLLTKDRQFFIPGAQIGIYDNVSLGTDTLIGIATTSDSNGEFTLTWKAVPKRSGMYWNFYAVSVTSSDYTDARSQEYRLSVTQTTPVGPTPLTLDFSRDPPAERIQEGDTITFSGQLLTKDRQFFISGAQIAIKDNVSGGTDTQIGTVTTSDTDGTFTFTWKAVPRIYSGDYQFYAETLYDPDYQKARSQEYRLSVTQTTPTGPTPLTLILNQVPSTAQEGDTITFSGQLLTKDRQFFISGAQIAIKDNVSGGTDTQIGTVTTSDTDGTFTFTWKAVPRIYSGDYQFYAETLYDPDYQKARSQEYRLSVTQTTPTGPTPLTLILNQVPSTAQEGDTITFSGQLLTKDRQFFISGAQIAIKDNVSGGTDTQIGTVTTSDTDGTFTFTWKAVPRIYSGDYQFYAETLYDPDYQKARSQEYRLSVTQTTPVGPTPTTLLFSLPPSIGSEVQEGDTITFSGQLVTKDIQTGKISSIPGATIYIYDNVSLGKDTLIGKAVTNDPTGIFGFTWKAVPRIYSGDYQFYAIFEGTPDYGKARSQEYRLSVTAITQPILPHTITGGIVVSIIVNAADSSIKIEIVAADDGVLTITLNEEIIKPFEDRTFFVMVDNQEVNFDQNGNTLSIPFQAGAKKIEIVGGSISPTSPTINISTDKTSYQSGDTIYISGTITNPIEGKDVTITVVAPSGDVVALDQITVPSSGTFQTKFVFDRQDTGTYTVTANIGVFASDTLTFKFTKSQIEASSSILVLDPIPSKVKLGDTISLTGKLTNDLGEPIAGKTIHLIDGTTNKSVFSKSTTSDGKIEIVWTAGRGDETYSWYMFFEGDNQFESASSKTYSGVATSVYLSTELYFQPLANKIESGQTVKFSGQLSLGGMPLAGKTIYIKDDVSLDTDRVIKTITTNSNGEFTATWTAVPRSDGGSYDFYAIFEGDTEANKVRSASYSVYVSVIQVFEQIRVFTEKTVFEVSDVLRVYGTATPNEELQVALMDSNENVISQKTIRAGSTGSYDTVLLTWQTSARLGFGEYTVIVWSQVDERYDYSYVSFVKSEPETYQTKISLNRPPSSVVLNQQITFTGQLQTIDGKPLGSTKVGIATVSEYTQTAESIATGVTDSSGRFSITWTAEHTRSSATMPVYAYFVGNQVFEYSVSNSYSITIEKPKLSVYTEKFSYETGESLKVYGYANSNDRINLVLKSPTGQVVLSESNVPTGSLGLFSHTFDTLPSNLSVGTYTVTATSKSFGISASTKIAIESDAVFETIDIVGNAYYTSYSGYVEYPLEGIKTVLTTGANQRVDYTDASGNFEFDDIKFDSQVDYLLHFEMTDGKSFNFVDYKIYDYDDYNYDKNPPIIKSDTMRLLLDNTIAVNQFSLNLNLKMPDRYDDTDSRYIFKTFDYQTKVVKFYNKVLNERPPLINVFLFYEGSHYRPTGWNSNTHSVQSGYWQPHIAISNSGSWSGIGMEYTHYAQDYAYQKMLGIDGQPMKDNHAGFSNPSTADSWIEGVGSFMPAVIAEWYNMREAGTFQSVILEDNRYKPNSNYFNPGTYWLDEERSIATLLWDLYDKRQDGENITLGINEIWNLIKAYDNFENYNPEYDYKKKYNYRDRFSSDDRHIKYFKDFYEYMSDYDVNHDGRVDSSDQRMVDDVFALHGMPNGLTDPNRSDRV